MKAVKSQQQRYQKDAIDVVLISLLLKNENMLRLFLVFLLVTFNRYMVTGNEPQI